MKIHEIHDLRFYLTLSISRNLLKNLKHSFTHLENKTLKCLLLTEQICKAFFRLTLRKISMLL